jgi:hypothetical protein
LFILPLTLTRDNSGRIKIEPSSPKLGMPSSEPPPHPTRSEHQHQGDPTVENVRTVPLMTVNLSPTHAQDADEVESTVPLSSAAETKPPAKTFPGVSARARVNRIFLAITHFSSADSTSGSTLVPRYVAQMISGQFLMSYISARRLSTSFCLFPPQCLTLDDSARIKIEPPSPTTVLPSSTSRSKRKRIGRPPTRQTVR